MMSRYLILEHIAFSTCKDTVVKAQYTSAMSNVNILCRLFVLMCIACWASYAAGQGINLDATLDKVHRDAHNALHLGFISIRRRSWNH